MHGISGIFSTGWWKQAETPRWVLALGGAFAVILPLVGNYWMTNDARVADRRAQEVQLLSDSMVEFQTFAAAFAAEMMEERTVAATTRTRLLENLNEQYARVRALEAEIAEAGLAQTTEYRSRIQAMIDTVHKTTDFMSLREFWSAASDLTAARNRLGPALRAHV